MKYKLATTALLLTLATLLPAADPAADPISPQLQSSIDRGLEWLATKQSPQNGSWKGTDSPSTAITSLAIMAYMARGHVPGQGPYGDHLHRGIDFVLAQQKSSGLLITQSDANPGGHPMYDHAIATIMLCEAYGMVDEPRQKKILPAVSQAIRIILNAQTIRKNPRDQGGWRYLPDSSDSDISVSGWQLMALRGAANIGASVPKKAIDDGIFYIKRRAVPSGGFSYVEASNPNLGRTGTGILSLELLGEHHSKESLAAGDYLLRNPIHEAEKKAPDFYFYAAYYCAQAANQLGGKYWTGINTPIRNWLLQKQRPDGSWNGGMESQGGDAYPTTMALLALTVQYRYLPIYQR